MPVFLLLVWMWGGGNRGENHTVKWDTPWGGPGIVWSDDSVMFFFQPIVHRDPGIPDYTFVHLVQPEIPDSDSGTLRIIWEDSFLYGAVFAHWLLITLWLAIWLGGLAYWQRRKRHFTNHSTVHPSPE